MQWRSPEPVRLYPSLGFTFTLPYIHDWNLPGEITAFFCLLATNPTPLRMYTHVCRAHAHAPPCIQMSNTIFPILQSTTHPLIFCILLSFSLTHMHATATAVGFHLIQLSSHVITALNSSPRREGARPHRVFTGRSIWTRRRHSYGVLFGVKDTLEDQKRVDIYHMLKIIYFASSGWVSGNVIRCYADDSSYARYLVEVTP